jgi:hypothetical protein
VYLSLPWVIHGGGLAWELACRDSTSTAPAGPSTRRHRPPWLDGLDIGRLGRRGSLRRFGCYGVRDADLGIVRCMVWLAGTLRLSRVTPLHEQAEGDLDNSVWDLGSSVWDLESVLGVVGLCYSLLSPLGGRDFCGLRSAGTGWVGFE